MRGKRAKQYRKLMHQYGLTFGFREPYQVLVDAQMIQDAERFKMDLVSGLERTLSGKVKPMITQCSIRHLYTLNSTGVFPQIKETLIATAKAMERRRCNHHELEEPLSTLECLSSVIDPKGSGTNKNRYVVASQEEEVRRRCRDLKGIPLVYVKRSVMVMEPMSEGSLGVKESAEREKFRQGLRGRVAGLGKRKREDEGVENGVGAKSKAAMNGEEKAAKKKRTRGPKGPNPLSVKKPKSNIKAMEVRSDTEGHDARAPEPTNVVGSKVDVDAVNSGETGDSHPSKRKKKRRRQKHKQNGLLTPAHNAESGDSAQELSKEL